MTDALSITVWRIPLDVELSQREQAVLSDAERDRAERFRFDHDRRRFVAAHVAMRRILAQSLSQSPESLAFTTGEFGKPELLNGGDWRFNLSHSGELALLAMTQGAPVGIDVEQLDRVRRGSAAIERYLSAREQHDLFSALANERESLMARLWVCKEAWLKATGEGLSRPLDSFDVVFESDQPRILAARPRPEDAVGWSMSLLDIGASCAAALAVRSPAVSVLMREYY